MSAIVHNCSGPSKASLATGFKFDGTFALANRIGLAAHIGVKNAKASVAQLAFWMGECFGLQHRPGDFKKFLSLRSIPVGESDAALHVALRNRSTKNRR